jgi:hypothetical protein
MLKSRREVLNILIYPKDQNFSMDELIKHIFLKLFISNGLKIIPAYTRQSIEWTQLDT